MGYHVGIPCGEITRPHTHLIYAVVTIVLKAVLVEAQKEGLPFNLFAL